MCLKLRHCKCKMYYRSFTANKSKEAMIHLVELLVVLMLGPLLARSPVAAQTKLGCNSTCGDLTDIPYPFGIRSDDKSCHFPEYTNSYVIDCSKTVPYWSDPTTNILIKEISLENHEMTIFVSVARDCYDAAGHQISSKSNDLSLSLFPMSSTKNKFTAIGCDTYAVFIGFQGSGYATGCLSLCNSIDDVTNGSCSGIGCCQTSIPRNVKWYDIALQSYSNHSDVLSFNPCSFAFVAENDYFNFTTASLLNLGEDKVPLVLEWSVGNQTCEDAQKNVTGYMCMENSYCSNATNGEGYRCHCMEGYQGNPYLSNGCQDIDECATSNPCSMTCINSPGTFSCSCPQGFEGDGWKNGTRCNPIVHKGNHSAREIGLGVSIALLFLLLCASWLMLGLRQRHATKERERFFRENGGLILQRLLSDHSNDLETMKVFTAEELQKATNNYNESTVLGQGGHGTVYKGTLMNNKIVAIKKAKMMDRSQVKEFINEVIVLSQINHKNVVRLIGCCLETEYPLLVYEFVTNGTLFEHVHDGSRISAVSSWGARLRIAAETAGALSYLHTDTAIQIVHRDVKSTNILLDENYVTKVSDFGASRLMPLDETQLNTLVQGTLGYLDPEYFLSSQLTEKSDVYSFGVVLAELLTGKEALSFKRPENERNLSLFFVLAVKEDRLFDIVDERILKDGPVDHIKEVASLASKCLKINGEERPTMKEVALELEGLLRDRKRHPWMQLQGADTFRETECLLGKTVEYSCGDISPTTTAEFSTVTTVNSSFNIEEWM